MFDTAPTDKLNQLHSAERYLWKCRSFGHSKNFWVLWNTRVCNPEHKTCVTHY